MPELPNNKRHQSHKQSHAEGHTEQIEAASGEIIAKEQTGFREGRETTEQIFILRILCEKYLQHQQDLYHVLIDFKKALNRVWHTALWATMKKNNAMINLIRVIKILCYKATSAVLFTLSKKKKKKATSSSGEKTESVGDWFQTTLGVRQGCLHSPTLFDIFLERIMADSCLRRSRRHCQHWRRNNHQSPLCWSHRWLSRRGRRIGKFS